MKEGFAMEETLVLTIKIKSPKHKELVFKLWKKRKNITELFLAFLELAN